jgi:hypothetical protein
MRLQQPAADVAGNLLRDRETVDQIAEEERNWLKAEQYKRMKASESLKIIRKIIKRFASLTLIDNIKP